MARATMPVVLDLFVRRVLASGAPVHAVPLDAAVLVLIYKPIRPTVEAAARFVRQVRLAAVVNAVALPAKLFAVANVSIHLPTHSTVESAPMHALEDRPASLDSASALRAQACVVGFVHKLPRIQKTVEAAARCALAERLV